MDDARWDGQRVRVLDEQVANRLQDKGSYGVRTGEGLVLDLHEAAFLIAEGRLNVVGPDGDLTPTSCLQLGARTHGPVDGIGFEVRHVAYRDIRSRGYVATAKEGRFEVLPRGGRPQATPPVAHVVPLSDGTPIGPKRLADALTTAKRAGCALWLAVVDADADVTYYDVRPVHITGTAAPPADASGVELVVLADRVLATAGQHLLDEHGFGGRVGDVHVLSFAEAVYLADRGARVTPDAKALADAAHQVEPETDALQRIYATLRDANTIPKTGLKFGVRYRVYQGRVGDHHAPYLLHRWSSEWVGPAREVARLVRLAHSVRKKMVIVLDETMVEIAWTRP